MYHFQETILLSTLTTTAVGYFGRAVDADTNAVVPIYADDAGTPIAVVSGVANMAKTDSDGNLSFFIPPGTYHVDIFDPDAETFIRRFEDIPMTSTQGEQGEQGPEGPAGGANSTYVSRAIMAATAPPSNVSAIVAGDGTFTWREGDLSALVAAEPANFIPSSYPDAPAGAWVRVPGEGGFTTLAALKLGTYPVGRAIPAAIYGGSLWVARQKVELQPDFYGTIGPNDQSSVVDFDDELNLTVSLEDGGIGVLELQLASVAGHLREKHGASERNVRNRLALSGSLTDPTTIAVYGTSIVFGQFDGVTGPGVTANPVVKNGTPTGFGDGSVHAHNQIAAPYPETMNSLLQQVFGVGKVTVVNRGYSGDRWGSMYRRHRVDADEMACIIDCGPNDTNFATNNGLDQTGVFVATEPDTTPNYLGGYCADRTLDAARKFVARKILRGAMCLLVAPGPYASLIGYNGTAYAAAQIMRHYAEIVETIAREYGIDVIRESEIIGLFGNSEVTHDGIHPNDFGALYRAVRYSAHFIAGGIKNAPRISGARRITANKLTEALQVGNGVDNLATANVPNANSLAAPFFSATESATFVLGDGGTSETLYLVFYLEEDVKAVMPVGYTDALAAIQYQLDFNATQPKRRLDTVPTALRGTHPTFASQASLNPAGATDYNDPNDIDDHLVVVSRGLHVLGISVTAGTFALDGFLFGDFSDVGDAIPDATLATALAAPTGGATVDAESRAVIADLIASNQELQAKLDSVLARLRFSYEIKA